MNSSWALAHSPIPCMGTTRRLRANSGQVMCTPTSFGRMAAATRKICAALVASGPPATLVGRRRTPRAHALCCDQSAFPCSIVPPPGGTHGGRIAQMGPNTGRFQLQGTLLMSERPSTCGGLPLFEWLPLSSPILLSRRSLPPRATTCPRRTPLPINLRDLMLVFGSPQGHVKWVR